MIDRLRRLPQRKRIALAFWLHNAVLAAALLAYAVRG